jgi:hypothetical protein
MRSEYTAQGTQKLDDIARRYGMSKWDLGRINRMSSDSVLKKGDKIIVYVVKDPSRSQRADEQWKKTPRVMRGKVSGPRAASTSSAGARTAAEPRAASIDTASAKPAVDNSEDANSPGPVTKPTDVE